MIKNKRILVPGGAGSIGSELVRQLVANNEVYILDIAETPFFDLYEELKQKGLKIKGRMGDIRNEKTLTEVFEAFQPQVIFACAALKHVTPNEWDAEEAILTNSLATLQLTKLAHKHKVEKFVYISTDKAANADSIMGITKRLGEKIVKNAGYISVRFGNVLGSNGSLIPIWQRQLDKNQPITVTDERMTRFFMSIPEACELLIKAAEMGEPGDLMIMEMGEPVNVLNLAKEVLKKAGRPESDIKIIGMRSGETLTEKLMTEAEEARAVKKDNFFIIK